MKRKSRIREIDPEDRLGIFAKRGRAHFVSIDVQPCFLNDLHADRATFFPKEVSDFSSLLKERNIQTTWVECVVGCLGHVYGCRGQMSDCGNVKVPSDGLAAKKTHGDVFIKCTNSAFDSGKWLPSYFMADKDFTKGLANKEVSTLIIAGMNTTACVLATSLGAMSHNYSVIFVSDLLADGSYKNDEVDPLWHEKTLYEKMQGRHTSSYVVASREHVLKAYAAISQPKTPVLERVRKAVWDGLSF